MYATRNPVIEPSAWLASISNEENSAEKESEAAARARRHYGKKATEDSKKHYVQFELVVQTQKSAMTC